MEKPLVSVLLPAYNAENFIKTAVDSITNQTYLNLEIVLINDGSQDSTLKILQSFQDKRIKVINNERNLGLIETLNKGIGLCSGKYIARMDADDFSYPSRIEKQVNILENNTSVGICGTSFETYSNNVLKGISSYGEENDIIQLKQLHQIHLCHGTALFKNQILAKNNFNPKFSHAEDYELWSRIKSQCLMQNIDEILYRVNHHGENVSIKNKSTQESNTILVIKLQLEKIIGQEVSLNTAKLYERLNYSDFSFNKDELTSIGKLLVSIIKNQSQINTINEHSAAIYFSSLWDNLCYNCSVKKKYQIWKKYQFRSASLLHTIKFRLKSLI